MSSDHSKSDSPASSNVSLLSTETTSSTFAKTAKQKGTKHYLSSLAKYASGTRGKASSDPNIAAASTSGSASPTPSSASTPLPAAPSQMTLVNPAQQQPQKDYEAAFGALATSFGTAGHAPVVLKKAKTDAQPSATSASASASAAPRK